MAKENNLLMATHRKFFPVAAMPWHSEGHKFGEEDTDNLERYQLSKPGRY